MYFHPLYPLLYSQLLGIILICMALAVDAVYGNYQERFMKNHPNVSNAEIVSFGITWEG